MIKERSHHSRTTCSTPVKTEPLRRDQDLKLKGLQIESQVCIPCYSVNLRLFEEEEGQNSPIQKGLEASINP